MKKMVFGAGCLALGAMCLTAQADETVYVGQAIGSIDVQCNGCNAIAAVAFKEISGKDEYVSVSNIVSTEGLDVDDKVGIWWEGGYESWTLKKDAQGVNFWEKNEKKFSIDAYGKLTESSGADASTVRPPTGSGIWIRHEKGGEFTFHIFGAYVEPIPTKALGAIDGIPMKTLMGNPTFDAKAPTITGMTNLDSIQVTTGSGILTSYTYNESSGKWSCFKKEGAQVVVQTVDSPEIPAGVGFWYVARGADDVTFEW